MSLLGRPWRLREVADVEGLIRSILERQLGKRGAHLRTDVYDEAVCFLLEVAVRADRTYDSSRGPWEPFLRWRLSLGLVDFYRRELGRTRWAFGPDADHTHAGSTYERERPEVLSLDAGREHRLDAPDPTSEAELALGRIALERALNG